MRVVQGGDVTAPLYRVKAELFKTLGHPARIRVLELLVEQDRTVGELQVEVGLEASHMSQQLAVLRHAGVVVAHKQGTSVIYSLASPQVAGLLAAARRVLTELLSDQLSVLDDLKADARARTG